MSSRNALNIFLFLMVFVLIAILFIDTEKNTKNTFELSTLNASSVNQIEITRLTSGAIKFTKNNNQWFMISPYKIRANTFYIESLLQITQAKSLSKFNITNDDKNKFKLNPPQATLKLNTQLFLFGTNEQLHLNRYILSNKNLYLVPDRYFYLLNITTTGYIDHALISKNEKITSVKLANYTVQLKNKKWEIIPELDNTSTDDINQLITEWYHSQAIEILKLGSMNNLNIKFSIEIQLKGQANAIVFDVVFTDDYYLFIRADLKLQYKLNQDMAQRLFKIPSIIDN